MARGINKWIGVGNLGADPEIRHTGNGTAVVSFSVATSEQWTDKQSGQKQERTEWHNCTAWGQLAEIIAEYATKGRQVYVEGKLRTEKYTGKDGVERYTTKVNVEVFQLLGGSDRADGGAPRQGGGGRPQDRNTNLDQRGGQGAYGGSRGDASGAPPDDDDIPFRQYQHKQLF